MFPVVCSGLSSGLPEDRMSRCFFFFLYPLEVLQEWNRNTLSEWNEDILQGCTEDTLNI